MRIGTRTAILVASMLAGVASAHAGEGFSSGSSKLLVEFGETPAPSPEAEGSAGPKALPASPAAAVGAGPLPTRAQVSRARAGVYDITPNDRTIRGLVDRWAESSGYDVAWDIGTTDWEIQYSGKFGSNFYQALDLLLDGVNRHLVGGKGTSAKMYLVAEVHPNRVVRIYSARP